MSELLEAKVKISGTEEAVTEYAQAQQRMVQAAESLGTGADQKIEVDRLLAEVGLGPIQDIRQYTERCRREIDDIVKDWQEVHQKSTDVDKGKGQKGQRSKWLRKIRGMLSGAVSKIRITPDAIAEDIRKVSGNLFSMLTPGAMGVGGILGLMLWGVAETQKYEAEANRFVQIFEESTRTYSAKAEKADRMAAGKLAGVAKELEIQFGATRGELEAVAKAYGDAGISAGEAGSRVTKAYGTQMQTLYGLTLGLERHFELAGGTAARQAGEFMTKYGYSTKEAAEAVVELNFAGAKSGVGLATFTNAIAQATGGVRHMGINTKEVIGLTQQLTAQYEAIGVKKHFAGAEALQATQQILGGLGSFGMGEQVMLAERLGMGKGLEARSHLLNQLTREGGPDPQVLAGSITELRSMALEMSRGDPQSARAWLEGRMGFKGAKAIMDIGDKLAGGLTVEQLSKEEKKALAGAFKTEAQKTEEFQKFMRQSLEGVRKVGTALFDIVMAGLAELVLGVRYTIAVLKGEDKTAAAYSEAMKETAKIFPDALGRAWAGLKDIGGAGENLLGSVEGLQPLKKALEGIGEEDPPAAGQIEDIATGRRLDQPAGFGLGAGDPTDVAGINKLIRGDVAGARKAAGLRGGGPRRGGTIEPGYDPAGAATQPAQRSGSVTGVIGTQALSISATRHKAVRSGRKQQ